MACACGIAILVAVPSALEGIYEMDESDMDDDIARGMASLLDGFVSSGVDSLILDGGRMLPKDSWLNVHDGLVELYHNDRVHIWVTEFKGSFMMACGEEVTVIRRRSPRSS